MANIKKELNDIKNAVYGREVRGSIHDGIYKVNRESEGSKQIANNTKQRQDAVEQQFNTLLSEWSDDKPIDNAETIAARTNTKESKTYENLGKRLDEEYGKVTAQLAQIEHEMFKSSLVRHKVPSFKVWWIDDDGHKGVYTKLAPWLREYGIKMSSAVITNRPHGFPIQGLPAYNPNSQFMSYEQMKELESEGIVEFVPHSHTHDINHRLTDMTVEEMHEELSTCQNIMRQLGWNYRDFFYPFGSHNATVRGVVRQYFRSAITTSGGAFIPPVNQFALPRLGMDTRSAQEIIAEINKAYENNTLIILMSHVDQYGGLEESKMREVIEHVLSLGGEFVTSEEAINEFGNLLQLDSNNTISYDGEIHGRSIGVYRNGHINYEPNAPITEFKQGTVTRLKVRQFETADYNMPEFVVNDAALGFIEVHRDTYEDFFSYRKFVAVNRNYELLSKWNTNTNQWDNWEFLNGIVVLPPNSRNGSETISSFPQGSVSVVFINNDTANGTPDNRGGTLITYRLTSDDSGVYQEFKLLSTGNKYTRRWLRHDNVWEDWEQVGFRTYLLPDSFDVNSVPSDFPERRETVVFIRDANATGFPENIGGILTTYRLSTDNSFIYQEYKIRNANRKYMRTWSSAGWGDWEQV